MFNKKFFLLAAGYIAGGVVSSLYSKKKPKDLKAELKESKENWEWEFKILLNNFVDTHKNLLLDIESEIMSSKNKALFLEKKAQLLKIADMYKAEGNRLLEELKVNGKSYLIEASEKLETLYKEKKAELEELKQISPQKAIELKENLMEAFEEMKAKMKEQVKTKEEKGTEK